MTLRRLFAGLAILGLVAGLAGPARSQREDREETLERIREQIARLQAGLERIKRQESTAATQLEATRLELTLQETRVAEAETARGLAVERAEASAARVARLERELEEVKAQLRARLSGLYRLGRGGYLRLALALEPNADALAAIRQLRYLARRDGEARDRFLDARVRLAVEREDLAKERARVEALLVQERERRERLAVLQLEQSRFLARVERERRTLESRADELADKERKLSSFLAFLYGRNRAPLAGTPIQSFRGVLDWPVEGTVTTGFGPRLDPRYRTKTPHNGLDFATAPGSPVRVVYPGKVLFAAPFRGYGPTVIVHHAGDVFTLYAGLERLAVGEGDNLALGAVVGPSAETLYFEIRVKNEPQDPTGWLRQ